MAVIEKTIGQSEKKCSVCGKNYLRKKLIIPDFFEKVMDVAACPCEREQEAQKKNLKSENQLFKISELPMAFRSGLSEWVTIDGTENAYKGVQDYINNLSDNLNSGKGLLITGSPGTGKSMLTCAVGYFYIKAGIEIKYTSLSDLLIEIDNCKEKKTIYKIIRALRSYQVLIIDDIGESSVESRFHKYVFSLFDGRNSEKKVTLMNTMKSAEQLSELIGEHVVSRMLEMSAGNIFQIKSNVDMRDVNNKNKYLEI